ncbi:MAG TPA: hypothetical protein VFI79_10380 [Gemmatimonadales bacterium]|nr:hypothetical protein [Gemmatimonadales bacterium]
MIRLRVLAALSVTLGACSLDVAPLHTPKLILTPVLDSAFVGDLLLKRQVTYIDDHGNTADPGVVTWSTNDTSVISVDPGTGRITGHAPGIAALFADAQSTRGFAVIVVSPTLKVTLLVDSIMMMPGDTYTVPIEVVHKAAGAPTVWFTPVATATATVDSVTGRITANAVGGPVQVTAHAALAPDTVTDGGTVEVLQLSDTAGGSAYYTIFGTVQRARRVSVRGSVYPRTGGASTFRLTLTTIEGAITTEEADVVLRTPPAGPGVFPIDSLGIQESASQTLDPFCSPPRDWGQWFTLLQGARVDGVSRRGGSLTISQLVVVPNGLAISGRFYLPVQRTDRIDDPTGLLPIRGTFVAPVITGSANCH